MRRAHPSQAASVRSRTRPSMARTSGGGRSTRVRNASHPLRHIPPRSRSGSQGRGAVGIRTDCSSGGPDRNEFRVLPRGAAWTESDHNPGGSSSRYSTSLLSPRPGRGKSRSQRTRAPFRIHFSATLCPERRSPGQNSSRSGNRRRSAGPLASTTCLPRLSMRRMASSRSKSLRRAWMRNRSGSRS